MKKYLFTIVAVALSEMVFGQCLPTAQALLNVNNVTAPIDNDGSIGFHSNTSYTIDTENGLFNAGMSMGLWIGGLDQNNQLHLSAMRHGQIGNDYFPGPLNVTNAQTDPATCAEYDRIWKIEKWRVEEFLHRNGEVGYEVPPEILQWPAHGDFAQGYDFNLAPYYDADGSGNYNPLDGDYPGYGLNGQPIFPSYPMLHGNQSLWWVMNDNAGNHTESGGEPIGLEIRCQAYAFDECAPIANTTFYRYQIINRGGVTLHDTYIGIWVDADLGPTHDEYVQCDVQRNLGFTHDGYAIPWSTAFGVDMLSGPYMDSDGVDNDGDGTVDNEQHGMSKFQYHNNSSEAVPLFGNPSAPEDYYNYLQGRWLDGTPICYGQNGHPTSGCYQGVQADFMFPGNSDPMGLGTGGVPVTIWTEQTAGNVPSDRRFLLSCGPFTLHPGDVNDLHYAAIWATDPTGQDAIGALEDADDFIQAAFDSGFSNLPCCPPNAQIHLTQPGPNQFFFSSIASGDSYFWDFGDGWTSNERFPPSHHYIDNLEHTVMLIVSNDCGSDTAFMQAGTVFFGMEEFNLNETITLSPNPSDGSFTILQNDRSVMLRSVSVIDMVGALVFSSDEIGAQEVIGLNVSAGIYSVQIETDQGSTTKKLVVR